MRIILLGAFGAGKGTQAQFIMENLEFHKFLLVTCCVQPLRLALSSVSKRKR